MELPIDNWLCVRASNGLIFLLFTVAFRLLPQIYVSRMFFHTLKVTSSTINNHYTIFCECNFHKFELIDSAFNEINAGKNLFLKISPYFHSSFTREWMTTKDLGGCISEEPVFSLLLFDRRRSLRNQMVNSLNLHKVVAPDVYGFWILTLFLSLPLSIKINSCDQHSIIAR